MYIEKKTVLKNDLFCFDFIVSMKQILLQYGWRHTAILYDEDEVFFRRVGKNLALDFRQDDTLNRPYERPFSKSTVDFSSILTEASKFARGLLTIYINTYIF